MPEFEPLSIPILLNLLALYPLFMPTSKPRTLHDLKPLMESLVSISVTLQLTVVIWVLYLVYLMT